jgi:hypothetical protein
MTIKQHASRFMLICIKVWKCFLKKSFKKCEVNKESYLHIAIGAYNPRKLPKSDHDNIIMQK